MSSHDPDPGYPHLCGPDDHTPPRRASHATAEARVPTDRASRYLIQLCRHADQMRRMRLEPPGRLGGSRMPPRVQHVSYTDTTGTVRFAEGQLTLQASADTLTLRVDAADDDSLRRLQNGIAARLHKIGRRDQLMVTWHQMGALAVPSGDTAHGTDAAAEPGAGKPRWRRRLGWAGLLSAGALVIALHLGLGGAALAASALTDWAGNILLVIILVKVGFIAAHLIAGRYAYRRGKAMHARWKQRHSPTNPTPAIGPAAAAQEIATKEERT
jgi:hypothetical protein